MPQSLLMFQNLLFWSVLENNRLYCHCEAIRNSNNFSLPQVIFQWTYDLQNGDSLSSIGQLDNRQELTFSPLKVSHAGQYTCTASMANLTKSKKFKR